MFGVRFVSCAALAAFTIVLGPSAVHAQLVNGNQWPTPRLAVLTPTGGKVGTTFEVAFNGTECEEPTGLLFNHPGIKGTPIIPELPKPDPKEKDPKKAPVRPPITKFSVVIDKSVSSGYYDVRLVNKNGVSNPRRFVVGELNEVAEKESNNDVEPAHKIEIGTTVTGAISTPIDVDYFSFAGKKGQRLLITCLTASIDSRLDSEMRVINSKGDVIAYDRAHPNQDGLIDVTLPYDGDYLVRVNKFTYLLAGPEHFYRLNIAQTPHIEAVFPPMIEPGKTAAVTLYGRNLPGGKVNPSATMNGQALETLTVNIAAPSDPASQSQLKFSGQITPVVATLDGFEYRLRGPTGTSNPMLLTYAKAPVVLENDDNDTIEKAQTIPLPCEIAGRIDKKRDRDWYVFEAKKDQVFTIEVLSHRLGAPTDMYYVIKNLATKQDVTAQDDGNEPPLSLRFFTTHRDPPPFRFQAPSDGKYHMMLGSNTGDNFADPTHVYRVRITPEKPDFRLFVMPADENRPDACRIGQGGTHHFTVFALRTDGFKGDIRLSMEGLPPGVTCPPQTLAASMKSTHLVVLAADNAAEFTGAVRVTGTATINGQKVAHQARAASITWGVQPQQNIPTLTRIDHDLMLAVRDKAPGKLNAGKDKIAAKLGDKIDIPLKLSRSFPEFKANFQVQSVPAELPPGITVPNLTFAPGKDDLNAAVTIGPNTAPGTYNLVLRGFATISPNAKAKPVNTILTCTPIELTVLPKDVATLSIDPATPTFKPGADGVITVRVSRKYNYADAFKVELELPKESKGVTAQGVTIAPGANEAKLTLKIAPDTPPANLQNLTLRATAVVQTVALVHEIKIDVNIAK